MANRRSNLRNLLSDDEPIRKGRGYHLSSTEPEEQTTQEAVGENTVSRNVEKDKSRNLEELPRDVKRRKLGYEVREDLIRNLKRAAVEEDRKIYEVLEEALEEYIDRKQNVQQ